MVRALRHNVIVQPGGRIEIASDDLPAGTHAEVIVLVDENQRQKSYLSLFGCGKGAFPSPEAADQFLRQERDAWER